VVLTHKLHNRLACREVEALSHTHTKVARTLIVEFAYGCPE
jgi:hypothetical protein